VVNGGAKAVRIGATKVLISHGESLSGLTIEASLSHWTCSVPDTKLVLYLLQDKLTSGDKSLDLSSFKLSCLFFSLLSSGSSSCWRSYGA
ncbi:hypothetical protein Tco_0560625, partial [Tanacetum coccineum]